MAESEFETEADFTLRRLRSLVHLPLKDELEAVIYKARWIDGIKNGNMASDEAIANAILDLLKDKE